MSRMMRNDVVIGGSSNESTEILYEPSGRAETNVSDELDKINGDISQINTDLSAFSSALRFPELAPDNNLINIQSVGDYGFKIFRFNADTLNNPTSSGGSGVALTFRISQSIAVQLAFTYINQNIYVRTKTNNTWTTWRTI